MAPALWFSIAAVPAQMAVISEKLTNVLGHPKDEDEAASLSLHIELDLSDPKVARQDKGVGPEEVCFQDLWRVLGLPCLMVFIGGGGGL